MTPKESRPFARRSWTVTSRESRCRGSKVDLYPELQEGTTPFDGRGDSVVFSALNLGPIVRNRTPYHAETLLRVTYFERQFRKFVLRREIGYDASGFDLSDKKADNNSNNKCDDKTRIQNL